MSSPVPEPGTVCCPTIATLSTRPMVTPPGAAGTCDGFDNKVPERVCQSRIRRQAGEPAMDVESLNGADPTTNWPICMCPASDSDN